MSYFRQHIDEMAAYVPGEQPDAMGRVIKLNTNESPYPPSPAAMAVLHEFAPERLRLYPHPMAGRFRQVAAELHGMDEEWVLPGNGSDDLLMMIAYSCYEPGRTVAYPTPNFTFYRTLADIQQAKAVEVPYDDEFNLPAAELVEAGADVTIVSSPNSPSGTGHTTAELGGLAERLKGLLVIDEAYADFADTDAMELVRLHDNVIVLRTLSKGYSLAGLRLGYAIARPELIEGLLKVKGIYNVGAVPCMVAAAALADQDYHAACGEKVKASRAKLAADLEAMGFRVWPSAANFLLVRPPGGQAREIYEALKDRGILIRYFKHPPLEDKLRISIGTDEQNAALVAAIADILGQSGAGG
jgi:histidinol-phosphate aminotransferase